MTVMPCDSLAALAAAVVDKYGFLWTGSGSFQYSSTSGTYSVLRFDTGITSLNDPAMTIFAVQMTDMANVRL